MKIFQKTILSVFISMLFITSMLIVMVSPVRAQKLIWEALVLSTGEEVVSPVLEDGRLYRIEATEIFWYDFPKKLTADAQYYTKDGYNIWVQWEWVSVYPAPDGHSFLQINGEDVDWGPFSNGVWIGGVAAAGHTYTIDYVGEGAAITFRIVDWIDGDYTNNDSHLPVKIYEIPVVGGYILDTNPLKTLISGIISAMMIAVLITVPFIKYCRKTHGRKLVLRITNDTSVFLYSLIIVIQCLMLRPILQRL